MNNERKDPRTKVDRNLRLYKFWLTHPNWSYESIANQFRISKARAWHIIYKMDKEDREQAKTGGQLENPEALNNNPT